MISTEIENSCEKDVRLTSNFFVNEAFRKHGSAMTSKREQVKFRQANHNPIMPFKAVSMFEEMLHIHIPSRCSEKSNQNE
jgi:hypothetical protein